MELYLDDNDTVEKLKQQLTIYKSLNHDLTKKVQELKIELKDTKSELTITQKKLIDEQQNSKEYKRCLNTINSQCFEFCKSYFKTVDEISEQNPNITLNFPKQDQQSDEETPNNSKQQQSKQINKPPRRRSLPNDAELLGAITEESMNLHTSTPFQFFPARQHAKNFMRSFSSMSSNNDDSIQDTPKKAHTSRSRRLSERLSSNDDEDESPKQSALLMQAQGLKECTVDVTLLRQSEAQRLIEEQQPDSGINDEEFTPPKKVDEREDPKSKEILVPSKKAIEKKQVKQPHETSNEKETAPPKKVGDKSKEKAEKHHETSKDESEDEKVPKTSKKAKKQIDDTYEDDTEEDEETPPKKAKKNKLKERQEKAKDDLFKAPKAKGAKKDGKENDEEKSLKRKKNTSESSEDTSTEEGGRAKRHKRKEVTYKEPSLNAKMRRPKEKPI